jgi:hypothetical protein
VAYGAIAAWQRDPNYCAAGLQALDDAQQAMAAAVGTEDMFRLCGA